MWSASSLLHRRTETTYREVIRICLPLVLSLSATTVMEFTDRVFLANHSLAAIAAAVPAGITSYLLLAFFGGVGGYAGVFIAQYTGRGEHHKIGAILWQGIHFTLVSGILLYLFALVATTPIFKIAGHSPEIRMQEEIYFSLLCKGSILHIAMVTLSTFFTGRGLTRPVMIITIIGVVMNIPLDYALIFGKWGFPELGIRGAAIATIMAWSINVICLAVLIFTPQHNSTYKVFHSWKPRIDIFIRLMRFGIPGALQFTMDILAFTLFLLLVGRIGDEALAATNVVLSINALAFMPSMGVSQGVSVLVGQALGNEKPQLASTHVRCASYLLIVYILMIDLLFIFVPDLILAPFLHSATGAQAAEVRLISLSLLKIISAYLFFDALYMVFSGALRGAGDTRFMMIAITLTAPLTLILPVYFGIEFFNISIVSAWLWVLLFVFSLFMLSGLRYRRGLWRNMLVIGRRNTPL